MAIYQDYAVYTIHLTNVPVDFLRLTTRSTGYRGLPMYADKTAKLKDFKIVKNTVSVEISASTNHVLPIIVGSSDGYLYMGIPSHMRDVFCQETSITWVGDCYNLREVFEICSRVYNVTTPQIVES